jgi:hypothetical protein
MKVSWDDYSQSKNKIHVPNHQPAMLIAVLPLTPSLLCNKTPKRPAVGIAKLGGGIH